MHTQSITTDEMIETMISRKISDMLMVIDPLADDDKTYKFIDSEYKKFRKSLEKLGFSTAESFYHAGTMLDRFYVYKQQMAEEKARTSYLEEIARLKTALESRRIAE